MSESASEQPHEATRVPIAASPQPAAPPVVPGPHYAAHQYTTYTPPIIPHEVWTPQLADKMVAAWKDNDDKNRESFDAQRRRDHAKSLLGFGLLAVVVLTGIAMMIAGQNGGQEIVIGALAFVAGFMAGDGNAKAQR